MEQIPSNNNDIKSRLENLKKELQSEPVNEEPIMKPELSDIEDVNLKRHRFVDEYMIDLNGAAAARRAGYSEESARSIASQLLTFPDVKDMIRQRQQAMVQRNELSREYIVQQLYRVIDGCEDSEDGDRATVLKAIDIMNKMMGNYSTTVTNININDVPLFPDTIDITPTEE